MDGAGLTDKLRGDDSGPLLIRLDVIGWFDGLDADFGQTGHLVGLDKQIAALQAVRDRLSDRYGGCDWAGRRLQSHSHDGQHK